MLPRVVLVTAVFVLAQVSVIAQDVLPPVESATNAPSETKPARAFLNRHCVECHGPEKPKGMFRVDRLSADFGDPAERERWQAVLKRVGAGEMPPKTKPRPS